MTVVSARERLVEAAVEAFAEKGFTATTTRDIASRAGMSPAAVYVHHDSKEDLLFHVSLEGHRAALAVVESASAVDADPVARLRRLVHDFSLWHAVNSRVGRIVQYEFHALSDAHRAEIAELRRAIEHVAQEVLRAGVATGTFTVDDVAGTARSILSLSIDLVRWFDQERPARAEHVAALHADLAERMVRAR